jgi:poly(A) polymerase
VRFIGDAAARIEEDYLRVLRYFRFHFRLTPEADMQPDALAACRAAAVGLRGLSGERKQQEMLKIMSLPDAAKAARALHKADLWRAIIGVEPVEFDMLAALVPLSDDPLLRLMSLLPNSAAAQSMAAALRLSNKQKMRLAKALEMPLDVAHLPAALYFDGAQAVADRALLALADLGAAGADDAAQDKLHAAVVAARAYEKPKFPLTGAMMQKAGLADGPAMGTMSQTLERWWVAEGFPNAAAVEAELKRRV